MGRPKFGVRVQISTNILEDAKTFKLNKNTTWSVPFFSPCYIDLSKNLGHPIICWINWSFTLFSPAFQSSCLHDR